MRDFYPPRTSSEWLHGDVCVWPITPCTNVVRRLQRERFGGRRNQSKPGFQSTSKHRCLSFWRLPGDGIFRNRQIALANDCPHCRGVPSCCDFTGSLLRLTKNCTLSGGSEQVVAGLRLNQPKMLCGPLAKQSKSGGKNSTHSCSQKCIRKLSFPLLSLR